VLFLPAQVVSESRMSRERHSVCVEALHSAALRIVTRNVEFAWLVRAGSWSLYASRVLQLSSPCAVRGPFGWYESLRASGLCVMVDFTYRTISRDGYIPRSSIAK
jgi:hypothetical protein